MQKVISNVKRHAVWGATVVALASATAVAAKNWDDWEAPANMNSMSTPDINTPAVDGCASHSHDGLTIAFTSNRTGDFDVYVATRASRSDDFGPAEALPAPVNTSANDACPTIATGNRIYFSSDRDDPAYDIYVTKRGPKGWSAPTRLGPEINTSDMLEETADFYEDEEGREVMIFTRRSTDGAEADIFESVEGGPPSLVQGGPHSSAADARASVTNDGLTIFWDSTRSGTLGGPDLYYATRSSTSEPFGTAVHLVSLSGTGFDARPFISGDGTFLTYSSARAGNASPAPDIWFATREKVTGN